MPWERMSLQPPEDLLCPVCQDTFADPVVLSCSHSFCQGCLQTWWRGKPSRECPLCNRRSSRSEPPCNLALKNLCKAFLLQSPPPGPPLLCSLHSERLKLFCLEHQQPVCLICRDSRRHSGHRFRPAEEAAREQREELQRALRPLQSQLRLLQQARHNCQLVAEHTQLQAQHTHGQIREQFKALHQFLREEEEARLAVLEEEAEQKSGAIKRHAEALSRDIQVLSDAVGAAEEELRADDVAFLQLYAAAAKRIQQRPLLGDPQLPPGALIDVARHLGNLGFNVWNKMKQAVSYAPVILDPNTANPEFHLSDDLTAVRHGERRSLPENPERVPHYRSVRGWEGIGSGHRRWDVEVGDNGAWFVGVTEGQNCGFWHFEFYNNRYSLRSAESPPAVLRVRRRLQRVRVLLDWNRGKLSWVDPDTNTHIHTVTHSFSQTLFPCIGTVSQPPLKVLEGQVSVTRE